MKSSHLPASVLTEEEFAWAVGIVKSRSVVLDNQVRAYRFSFSHYVLSIDSSQSSSPSALYFTFLSLSLSLTFLSIPLYLPQFPNHSKSAPVYVPFSPSLFLSVPSHSVSVSVPIRPCSWLSILVSIPIFHSQFIFSV